MPSTYKGPGTESSTRKQQVQSLSGLVLMVRVLTGAFDVLATYRESR